VSRYKFQVKVISPGAGALLVIKELSRYVDYEFVMVVEANCKNMCQTNELYCPC